MKLLRILTSPHSLILAGLLAAGSLQGCQTTTGGQTLPSATSLHDDVQYAPAGSKDKLYNQRRALQEYAAAQAAAETAEANPEASPAGTYQ